MKTLVVFGRNSALGAVLEETCPEGWRLWDSPNDASDVVAVRKNAPNAIVSVNLKSFMLIYLSITMSSV